MAALRTPRARPVKAIATGLGALLLTAWDPAPSLSFVNNSGRPVQIVDAHAAGSIPGATAPSKLLLDGDHSKRVAVTYSSDDRRGLRSAPVELTLKSRRTNRAKQKRLLLFRPRLKVRSMF